MAERTPFWRLLWGDFNLMTGMVGIAALVITLPTLSFTAFLEKTFGDHKTVLDAIVATWPLTISLTIFFMLVWRGWLREASGFDRIFGIAAVVILPYAVALMFGAVDSVDRRLLSSSTSWIVFFHPAHMLELAGNILLYYFSLDGGLIRTFQSVVAALFLACAYEGVLLPRARHLKSAMMNPGGEAGSDSDRP